MYLSKHSAILTALILFSLAQAQERNILHVLDTGTDRKDVPGGYCAFCSTTSVELPSNDVYYAINSSAFGSRIIAEAGVVVTNGTKATLNFDFTTRAITSDMIDAQDHYFENSLNETEKKSYHAMKESYGGGLTVPMLNWIGINLAENVTRKDMYISAQHTRNYNELAHHVETVMNTTTEQTIRIKGTLEAEGISPVPTFVFAFIREAQVELTDGSAKRIVTSGGHELVAGTKESTTAPYGTGKIKIVPIVSCVEP